jgi:hypothetical protein
MFSEPSIRKSFGYDLTVGCLTSVVQQELTAIAKATRGPP